MTIDVDKAFSANPRSVLVFLQTPGQGCYIPAYQREYRWDRGNVNRLFEDALGGISALLERPNTVSFLGTIIAVHDTKYVTVKPHFRNEMPSKVMTIIDGQQRISTFVLAFIAIHNLLSTVLPFLEKDESEEGQWLFGEVERMMAALWQCFIHDNVSGRDLHRYYPRLIRSFDDVWSSRPDSAKYTSPIALLVWSYLEHAMNEETKAKLFRPKVVEGERAASHESVKTVYDSIVRKLRELTKPSEDMPNVIEQAVSKGFGVALFGYDVPHKVAERVTPVAEDAAARRFQQAFAALIFAHYLQRRMAFTLVESAGEDDAFDMFEALNTTGQPLTAFETFRPRVIEAEGLEDYRDTPSYGHIQQVERYLDRYGSDTKKLERSTSELLVAFALAESGSKLGKKLNEQRGYLRQNYAEPEDDVDSSARRAFTRRLADIAAFMDSSWNPANKAPDFSGLAPIDEKTRVALDFLRSLDHTITIAPLSRFFSDALHASDETKEQAVQAFSDATRLCAAFSAIWRGWFDGKTERIDSVYREVMSIGDGTRALAANPKGSVEGTVQVTLLRQVLRKAMDEKGITDRAAWANRLQSSTVGANSKLAKFLLIVAHHNVVPQDDGSGLVKAGRSGTSPTLNPVAWAQFDPMEVEHIAPVSGAGSTWSQDLYGDDDRFQTLGNLTLLEKSQNIVMSDHPWATKKAGYEALAAETEEEFSAARESAEKAGLSLPERSEIVLATSRYSPMLVPLARTTSDWNGELVQNRSERLAELAWDTLNSWLD